MAAIKESFEVCPPKSIGWFYWKLVKIFLRSVLFKDCFSILHSIWPSSIGEELLWNNMADIFATKHKCSVKLSLFRDVLFRLHFIKIAVFTKKKKNNQICFSSLATRGLYWDSSSHGPVSKLCALRSPRLPLLLKRNQVNTLFFKPTGSFLFITIDMFFEGIFLHYRHIHWMYFSSKEPEVIHILLINQLSRWYFQFSTSLVWDRIFSLELCWWWNRTPQGNMSHKVV